MTKNRFDLEVQVQIDDEWHTISHKTSCGSQDTGKFRNMASNSTVPMRVIEIHD